MCANKGLFSLAREIGRFNQLHFTVVELLRLGVFARLFQDDPLHIQCPGHVAHIILFFCCGIGAVAVLECQGGVAAIDVKDHHVEPREPAFTIVPGRRQHLMQIGLGLIMLPHVKMTACDPLLRGNEIRVFGERHSVVFDRLVEFSLFQKELRVRVVGIGVTRNQLDVLFEGLLGLRVLPERPVGISKTVVSGRICRSQFRRGFELPGGAGEVLHIIVVIAEEVVCPFVLWTRGNQFIQELFPFRHIADRSRLGCEYDKPLSL